MSRPIIFLRNTSNWRQILRRNYVSQKFSNKKFTPLPPAIIDSKSRLFIIGATSQEGLKRGWKLGGWITPSLTFKPNGATVASTTGIANYRFWLGKLTLLSLPEIEINAPAPATKNYRLRIDFPKWIPGITLEMWEYRGVDLCTTEELCKQIKSQVEIVDTKVTDIASYQS